MTEPPARAPDAASTVDGADHARKLLLAGAVCIGIGLLIAGTENPTLGGVFVVAGWLAFVYGIHRFGRTGTA